MIITIFKLIVHYEVTPLFYICSLETIVHRTIYIFHSQECAYNEAYIFFFFLAKYVINDAIYTIYNTRPSCYYKIKSSVVTLTQVINTFRKKRKIDEIMILFSFFYGFSS